MPDGVDCFGDSAQASCRFLGFAEGSTPKKKQIFPILIYTIDSPADFPLGK